MTIQGINTLSATYHSEQAPSIQEWIGCGTPVSRKYGSTGIAKVEFGSQDVIVDVSTRHSMTTIAISTEMNNSLTSGLINQLTMQGTKFTQLLEDAYAGPTAVNVNRILTQNIRPSRRKSSRTGLILHLPVMPSSKPMNRLIKAFVVALHQMSEVNPAFTNLASLVELDIRTNTSVYSK